MDGGFLPAGGGIVMTGWAFRKAHLWLSLMGLALFMLTAAVLPSLYTSGTAWDRRHEQMSRLVEELSLTDLCLFTDAHYLRNLTQADHHAPFQDNPAAFDYFPSGSLVVPPVSLWEATRDLASDSD
jgi:hypothetical protein